MSDKQLERQESNTEPDPRYFVPLKRRYSESENQVIKNFMHEDFPHIRYGWLRDRGIIIEYPPKIIAEKQEWREALDTVLKPEIGELHPNIRRRRMIVRFVDKLHIEGRISVSGDCRSVITDGR